jgi:nucleoside-triphosphatase THEP1
MEDPIITLIEDDAEFIMDKVQGTGEEVVHITEEKREEIMANIIEVHETIKQL